MKNSVFSIVAGWLLVFAATSFADVVFLEPFTNSVAADAPLTSINWNSVITANGTVYTGAAGSGGPILSSADYLFCFPGAAITGQPWLAWTAKTEVNAIGSISGVTGMSMGWVHNDNSTSEDLKFAIKVDGNWYVSQAVFNGSGGVQCSINVQTAGWNRLNFVAGSILMEGASASLPSSGTVTAVGVFDASGSGSKVRVDNFTVEATPVPLRTVSLFVISS